MSDNGKGGSGVDGGDDDCSCGDGKCDGSSSGNGVEKRRFSLAALPISLYRDIPKPNVNLHGRVDTAGLPRAD